MGLRHFLKQFQEQIILEVKKPRTWLREFCDIDQQLAKPPVRMSLPQFLKGMKDCGDSFWISHFYFSHMSSKKPGSSCSRSPSPAPATGRRTASCRSACGRPSVAARLPVPGTAASRCHKARPGKCRPCTRPLSPSRACRARRAARQCPLGCGRRTRASARRAVGCGRCGRWCGSVEAWFNFLHGCIIRHRCDEMCRFLWAASASLFCRNAE